MFHSPRWHVLGVVEHKAANIQEIPIGPHRLATCCPFSGPTNQGLRSLHTEREDVG